MSFNSKIRQAGVQARQARAAERVASVAPVIAELRAAGITSRNRIAAALNERGVLTPRGRHHWYPMQVSRVLARLPGLGGRPRPFSPR
jgi:hypothetical protein